MFSRLFSKMWMFCRMIFGPICDVLPPAQQNVDVLSQDLEHICDVQPASQQNVDVFSHDF
jgi:hypothetical protein